MRPAVALVATAGRTPTLTRLRTQVSGCRADSINIATPDTTEQSCRCRIWRGGVNWTKQLTCAQTSSFLSTTLLSCRESNSNCGSGRDTDKTVLSRLAWRCELALSCNKCPCNWRNPWGDPPPQKNCVIRHCRFSFIFRDSSKPVRVLGSYNRKPFRGRPSEVITIMFFEPIITLFVYSYNNLIIIAAATI